MFSRGDAQLFFRKYNLTVCCTCCILQQRSTLASHVITVLLHTRKVVFLTSMRSCAFSLDVQYSIGSFIYFLTLCVRPAEDHARLRIFAGSPDLSLQAYAISSKCYDMDKVN